MNLYFTYESRDTLKSSTFFITVKPISKLNTKHSDKYEMKILKFSRRGPLSPDNAEFGRIWSFQVVVLQRTAKKCTKIQNARAQPLFSSLNLLFGGFPVAVAVVVS